jgi:monoamine oxidase
MGDIAANGGFEAYELPGDDRLVTTSLQVVIDHLADGLDIRCGHGVDAVTNTGSGWRADTGIEADALIVTVPVGALRAGRIAFDPPLPDHVADALDHIGAGPVTKVFATYDTAWWPAIRPLRLAGQEWFTGITDMSDLTGSPTLVAFAVGDAARRIEQLDEDGLCRLLDRTLADTGLTSWDA